MAVEILYTDNQIVNHSIAVEDQIAENSNESTHVTRYHRAESNDTHEISNVLDRNHSIGTDKRIN